MAETWLLPILIFVAALLYSAVGHGGASGYLMAMGLFGLSSTVMKPSAFLLNILVASIGTVKFYRAGCFSWKVFLPFALGSVPLAYFGGGIELPNDLYKKFLGAILLFAAVRLWWPSATGEGESRHTAPFFGAIACGAGIGFLSGLTGTGGGIFLSPLILFMRWTGTRESAGVSAAFILVNSIAGLLGHAPNMQTLPAALPLWAVAAVVGGLIGSELGSRRLGNLTIRRLLAVALVVAGTKFLLSRAVPKPPVATAHRAAVVLRVTP